MMAFFVGARLRGAGVTTGTIAMGACPARWPHPGRARKLPRVGFPGADIMDDQTILDRITALVDEEKRLRMDAEAAPEQNADRLKAVGEQLDQCWDLLRQRRAKREFGADPNAAAPRDVGTVEGYVG
jgi:hypothetical protein